MPYYDKAQEAAERFVMLLHDALLDIPNSKQEQIAIDGSVKHNTVSQWLNPQNDRHFPAFQLLLQQEGIVLPLCKEFVKRFGFKIVPEEGGLKTDGDVNDQLLNIDVIQAEIIKLKDKNPKAAMKFCEDLILEATIAKKELESKIR